MDKEYQYMVCTKCFTFNHYDCIENALQGFSMQETSFPFINCVVDDASTDGTQDVLRLWAEQNLSIDNNEISYHRHLDSGELFCGPHKSNPKAFFALLLLTENHHRLHKPKWPYLAQWFEESKYYALCEGDDYWISPDKLQKQVEYMEKHEDCSMTFHNAIEFHVQTKQFKLFDGELGEYDLSMSDAINLWRIPTASIVYRAEFHERPVWMKRIYSGDYPLILRCCHYGRIHSIGGFKSIYRVNKIGDSYTAQTQGKYAFVLEQHIDLLESLNDGTNGQYSDIISKRIAYLQEEIQFQKMKKKNKFMSLFKRRFYKKLIHKTDEYFTLIWNSRPRFRE